MPGCQVTGLNQNKVVRSTHRWVQAKSTAGCSETVKRRQKEPKSGLRNKTTQLTDHPSNQKSLLGKNKEVKKSKQTWRRRDRKSRKISEQDMQKKRMQPSVHCKWASSTKHIGPRLSSCGVIHPHPQEQITQLTKHIRGVKHSSEIHNHCPLVKNHPAQYHTGTERV